MDDRRGLDLVPAPTLLIGAMLAFQAGASLATRLFDRVGPASATFMRTTVAAVTLFAFSRASLRGRARRELALLVLFGLLLTMLSVCFYEAISRAPLGVVVTIEFLGPLGVAVATSHRRLDLAWVALAGSGVALLAGGPGGARLDRLGLVFAVLAGASWAAYMLVAKRVGSLFHGSGGLAPALAVSALVLAPAGVVGGGWRMLHPSTIVLAIGVGLLSAALPFALELAALRRMRAATYGILVSLEPALAALAGLVFLGQRLGAPQATGVALVVAASIGSSKTAALVPVER